MAGTTEVEVDFLTRYYTVEGEVTSSAPDECYRVRSLAIYDFPFVYSDLVDHCGTGTTPFEWNPVGFGATSSFYLYLCRIPHAGAEQTTSCSVRQSI